MPAPHKRRMNSQGRQPLLLQPPPSTLTITGFRFIKYKPHTVPRNSVPILGETSETVVWGLFLWLGSPNQKEFSLPHSSVPKPGKRPALFSFWDPTYTHTGAKLGHPRQDMILDLGPCSMGTAVLSQNTGEKASVRPREQLVSQAYPPGS